MKESVSNDLIHFGINLGFGMFLFGFFFGVATCIIKCYNTDDFHDHDNNDDHVTITITECAGIKPNVLRSIPVVDLNAQDFKDGVECVVCLSELVDGDKATVLPSCSHWFHADCIDSWFRSHSTCPICRKRVCLEQPETRPELGGGDDESLTQNQDPMSETLALEFPTESSPRSRNTVIVEDVYCGGSDEGQPDLTVAVIDIPAKTN
ncbi:putative RING-H2 finger protein ATL61 [Cardamine amara subsp. amara]|uniref:RING-type E3 ubiquitin transferase n=1 Tax=Cardamine amara subsp. amara TaxID=228776 RepID=A0ABD1BEZ9_CARAN